MQVTKEVLPGEHRFGGERKQGEGGSQGKVPWRVASTGSCRGALGGYVASRGGPSLRRHSWAFTLLHLRKGSPFHSQFLLAKGLHTQG